MTGNTAERERLRNEGNIAYKAGRFEDAAELYAQAIAAVPDVPDATCLANRAAALLQLGRLDEALADCQAARTAQPGYMKSYVRAATILQRKGDLRGAREMLQDALMHDPVSEEALAARTALDAFRVRVAELVRAGEELASAAPQEAAQRVLEQAEAVLADAPALLEVRLTRCRALLRLHRAEAASAAATEIISQDRMCVPAIIYRGEALLLAGNVPVAATTLATALQLDPDNAEARTLLRVARQLEQLKQQGNAAYTAGQYEEAAALYARALQETLGGDDTRCPSYAAVLHANRAQALAKLNRHAEAVKECDAAIAIDENYVKAYLRRAAELQQVDRHEDAVRDLERARQLDPRNEEIPRLLRNAQLELRRARKKDYYKVQYHHHPHLFIVLLTTLSIGS